MNALYIENANDLGAVNEETIKTAVKTELINEGYELKDISTSTETVKGLLIKDSTGNNIDEVGLVQGANKKIAVALDTKGNTTTSTYVKVEGNYYELTINKKDVKVSTEAYKEITQDANSYEIKLTAPSNGVTMTVGGVPITSETLVEPGAEIVVQAGNLVDTFTFNVKETKTLKTRDVNVVVTANPLYATGLTIATKDNVEATVEVGKSIQLEATVTPKTSTDTVKWSIKSGSATVDDQGIVTANSNATVGSTIIVGATCIRDGEPVSAVGEKTFNITVKASETELPEVTDWVKALPKGYTVADANETDLQQGVWFTDEYDNEWTWVVVPRNEAFTSDKTAYMNGSEYNYTKIKEDLEAYVTGYRPGPFDDTWYDDVWGSECGLEYEDYYDLYNAMLASVYKYGGFWISRYEIGKGEWETPVSQQDMIPYNVVTLTESENLAEQLKIGDKNSSLMFGLQWDLTCKYLENPNYCHFDTRNDSTRMGKLL